MSAEIHVLVGATGAGKSTYARELARSAGGLRFAIDEWMQRLFADDRPEAAGYDWYAPRIARCNEMIWALASELARSGTPSVLEVGLTERAARRAFYERARAEGLALRLHLVDAPRELRWRRVEARNRERGETFALEVTREMFDFVEQMWEPPSAAELAEQRGQIIDTSVERRSGG